MVGKKRSPAAQMFILILFIGLPGMITGTALASVATTGLMAGRYLLDKGMEKSKVVEVVTVGALMGMLLPPPVRTRHGPHHCPAGALSRRF